MTAVNNLCTASIRVSITQFPTVNQRESYLTDIVKIDQVPKIIWVSKQNKTMKMSDTDEHLKINKGGTGRLKLSYSC